MHIFLHRRDHLPAPPGHHLFHRVHQTVLSAPRRDVPLVSGIYWRESLFFLSLQILIINTNIIASELSRRVSAKTAVIVMCVPFTVFAGPVWETAFFYFFCLFLNLHILWFFRHLLHKIILVCDPRVSVGAVGASTSVPRWGCTRHHSRDQPSPSPSSSFTSEIEVLTVVRESADLLLSRTDLSIS